MNENSLLVSIVVPVFNAERHIEKTISKLNEYCNKKNINFELILIDDCSKDNSFSIIKKIANQFPNDIRSYHLNKNMGQQYATAYGILHASGEIIVTIDDDLEYDYSLTLDLIQGIKEGKDLVYALNQSLDRQRTTRFLHATYMYVWRLLDIKRTSSFRAINTSIIDKHFLKKNMDNPYFSIDKILMYKKVDTLYLTSSHVSKQNSRYTLLGRIYIAYKFLRFSPKK